MEPSVAQVVSKNTGIEKALWDICAALYCDVVTGPPRPECHCHHCGWYRLGAGALGARP